MRRGMAQGLTALTLCALLTGCTKSAGAAVSRYTTSQTNAPPGSQATWSFDDVAVGTVPPGAQVVSGTWAVRAEADAPSALNALCQTGNAEWPVLLLNSDIYTDFDLSTRFKPISGRTDQAGGLVFRTQDDANYLITRANALENNVRLYTMINNTRTEIASADRPVASGVWHELAVEVRADHIRVRLDGDWVIDQRSSVFEAGPVGLWTKADSQTCFDDVRASVPG
jgi:hypothetical protein